MTSITEQFPASITTKEQAAKFLGLDYNKIHSIDFSIASDDTFAYVFGGADEAGNAHAGLPISEREKAWFWHVATTDDGLSPAAPWTVPLPVDTLEVFALPGGAFRIGYINDASRGTPVSSVLFTFERWSGTDTGAGSKIEDLPSKRVATHNGPLDATGPTRFFDVSFPYVANTHLRVGAVSTSALGDSGQGAGSSVFLPGSQDRVMPYVHDNVLNDNGDNYPGGLGPVVFLDADLGFGGPIGSWRRLIGWALAGSINQVPGHVDQDAYLTIGPPAIAADATFHGAGHVGWADGATYNFRAATPNERKTIMGAETPQSVAEALVFVETTSNPGPLPPGLTWNDGDSVDLTIKSEWDSATVGYSVNLP